MNPKIKTVLILLAVALAYVGIFQNQFLIDDYALSTQWPVIEGWGDVGAMWAQGSQPGTYLPLKMFFHAVHFHFWGLDPFGYHLMALLFHLLIVALVYRIAGLLTAHSGIAALAALLFGLHPVHVESVTSILTSVDLFGLLLFFTSFWLYLEAVHDPSEKEFYPLSLVFALLAVLSSRMALSLPFLVLFYEFCLRPGETSDRTLRRREMIQSAAPYFVIVVLYALVKAAVLGTWMHGRFLMDSFYLTMLVMVKALAQYIIIVFWPVHLSTNHILSTGIFSHTPADFSKTAVLLQSILDGGVLLSLAILGTAGYGLWERFRKEPLVAFCIGWFLIGLLPVFKIMLDGVYFGERYLYIPAFGFCLLVSCWAYQLYERKAAAPSREKLYRFSAVLLVVALIAFYAVRTGWRNRDWKDDLTFYSKEALLNPQSSLAQANRGVMYLQFGLHDEALDAFQRAVSLNPLEPNNYFMLAETYTQQGRHFEAIQFLKDAIEIDPDFTEAYVNLAVSYEALTLSGPAKEYLNKALALYEKQGRRQEAEAIQEVFENYFSNVPPTEENTVD